MQIGSDMVAWNEAAVNASGRVLTGYPYGPLNLPMFGQMTHQDPTKAKEGAQGGRAGFLQGDAEF